MTVLYEDRTKADFSFDPEILGNEVIRAVLEAFAFPYEAEVALTLVSEQDIHILNRTYRDTDRVTDVLSFPLLSLPGPGEFSKIETDPDNFNPDTGEVMLGDIVISTSHVKAQAAEYGHSEKREYAFLIVHSMLHLLGYDHETAEDEAEMTSLQEKVLETLCISRSSP